MPDGLLRLPAAIVGATTATALLIAVNMTLYMLCNMPQHVAHHPYCNTSRNMTQRVTTNASRHTGRHMLRHIANRAVNRLANHVAARH